MAIAHQIRNSRPVAYGKETAPVKSQKYLDWLHELPCVVTGSRKVEAAHVSYEAKHYGASGRGKGKKSSDRWALPLSPEAHRKQHNVNEEAFWAEQGMNPHIAALILWGVYNEHPYDQAASIARKLIKSGALRNAAMVPA